MVVDVVSITLIHSRVSAGRYSVGPVDGTGVLGVPRQIASSRGEQKPDHCTRAVTAEGHGAGTPCGCLCW